MPRMPYINADIDCCGIAELVDIQLARTPEDAILPVYRGTHDQGIILFSEARLRDNGSLTDWKGIGNQIRDFIRAKKLGTVVQLPTTKNPNSGNHVRAYLWRVNRTAMMKWGEEFVKDKPQYAHFTPHYNPWQRDREETW